MNNFLLIFIQCVLVLGVSSAVGESYRDLKSADGKTIRAKVLSYDKSSDMVLIERDNQKRYTVSPELFCAADKSMIRNWGLVESFMSDSSLKVSIKHIEERVDADYHKTLDGVDPEDLEVQDYICMDHYKITLDNRTAQAFDNIKIETILFVTTEVVNPDKDIDSKTKENFSIEEFDIGTIKGKTHEEISTREVRYECVIYKVNHREVKKFVTELAGVWIRITMKLSDGIEFVREIKEPDNLLAGIEWDAASQSIELKKD